jgi:hypothetical protein
VSEKKKTGLALPGVPRLAGAETKIKPISGVIGPVHNGLILLKFIFIFNFDFELFNLQIPRPC